MDFRDLLDKLGFDLNKVIVMRHRPEPPQLRRVLPWLAAERPDVFNAYQQTQNPDAEKALMKADYVASFIAHDQQAVFVGLYRRGDWQVLSERQLAKVPAIQELCRYGSAGVVHDGTANLFDLQLLEELQEFKGRLVVQWPAGRLWWRWAHTNAFPIHALHEESTLDAEMPPWDQLTLSWDDLTVLPTKWRAALQQWRGIYFICDRSDGKGYVGSAYGAQNLLGRWQNYVDSGHGGNKQLRQRDPHQWVFSILQRVSPDMEMEDVIRLESSWKDRLHTRDIGLNEN